MEKSFSNGLTVDSELSLKIFSSQQFDSIDRIVDDGDAKPYRFWLRLTSSQLEVRIGLQKINFGSATLLRPLMWFDQIDSRDPLQLTDGVYGILARYYFLNNANIWLWGLYGQDDTKGWEVISTSDKTVEYGGRIQYPLFKGEIAMTYHHRRLDIIKFSFAPDLSVANEPAENRLAVDAKWDLGVGFWFESVFIHQDMNILPFKYRKFINFGIDYTLPIGSGLNVLGEHLHIALTNKPFGTGESFNLSALLMNYNLGLLDRITAITFFDWENHQFSRYISWGRIYDNWSFYLNGFWNPDETNFLGFESETRSNFGAGKGIQVIVVFNH